MSYPQKEISYIGFPESYLRDRTTPERCAELSAAWYEGTLHKMRVEPDLKHLCANLCKVSGYKRK